MTGRTTISLCFMTKKGDAIWITKDSVTHAGEPGGCYAFCPLPAGLEECGRIFLVHVVATDSS